MSDSKITLIGLNKYLSYENKSLFDYLTLPDGIDKDTLCSNILQKGSEFEAQYPDAEYMRVSVGMWSKKWYWTFDKWYKLIQTKYDPLYNYDRTEEWTDDNEHEDNKQVSSSRSINTTESSTGNATDTTKSTHKGQNKTEQVNNTTGTVDNTAETVKSAFDSANYQPYEKVITDTVTTDNSTNNSVENVEDSTDVNGSANTKTDTIGTSMDGYSEGTNMDGTYKTTHHGHMYGNIGVMSSQDMFKQEAEVAYFNLYERISDIFINEYCIPIYI